MAGIDATLTFYPLKIAVLTISDTRDEETDRSGALLASRITDAGHTLAYKTIVADEVIAIRAQLHLYIDDAEVEVVITTGGTGFAPRDVTPEAVKPLLTREMDGFSGAVPPGRAAPPWAGPPRSRALFGGQAGLIFIFACRDPPAPARTAGTWCWPKNSTAVTAPARSRGLCAAPARGLRMSKLFKTPRRPGPRPHGRCVGQAGHRPRSRRRGSPGSAHRKPLRCAAKAARPRARCSRPRNWPASWRRSARRT